MAANDPPEWPMEWIDGLAAEGKGVTFKVTKSPTI